MSFQKKIIIFFSIIFIGIILLGIATYKSSQSVEDTDKWVRHTHEVIYESEEVLSATKDIVLGTRGFVITGDSLFLEPFIQSKNTVINHFKTLKELTSDNPAQQVRIDSLNKLITKRINLSVQIIQLRKEKGLKVAGKMILTLKGKFYMDEIRSVIGRINTNENELLKKRQEDNIKSYESFTRSFYILLASILLILIIVFIIIRYNLQVRKKAAEELLKANKELQNYIGQLKESEEKLRVVLDSAQIGAWDLNLAKDTAWRSLLHDQIFGYDHLLPEWGYEIFITHVIPEDREYAKQRFEEAYLKGKFSMECRIKRVNDNSLRWISAQGLAYKNEKGEIIKMMGIVIDINDRKKAEEELKNTLKEVSDYKYALDESAIIAITNQKGIIKYVNDNFCSISKYNRDELIGQDHSLINSGYHSKEFFSDLWVTIANGKIWRGEVKNKAKDGFIFWLDTTIVPFLDEAGKPYQYIAIRSDITERKKAEQELLNIAEELNKAQEIANSGSFERNFVTEIDTWSNNFYKIFEFNKEEVKPSFETFLSRVHPDDKHIAEEIKTTIENEKRMVEMEVRVIMPNGSAKWISINILPVFEGDSMIGLKGVTLDITERKQTQEQLVKVNTELEGFSYSVSHDLRAPLRAIIGFTSMLEEDYTDKLDEEAKRITGIIKNNTAKMGRLIDDLLAFSRLGRQPVVKTCIRTDVMVKEVIEEQNRLNSDHSVEWLVHPLPDINGDINLMRQVWINFISNAVKYSGKKEQPCIEIGSLTQDGRTVFFIKDNGAGFDEQFGNKLFKVFQRLHSAEEFEGTGIGLAIVEKIISKHGGSVWAEGEVNKGACFYFSMPKE